MTQGKTIFVLFHKIWHYFAKTIFALFHKTLRYFTNIFAILSQQYLLYCDKLTQMCSLLLHL